MTDATDPKRRTIRSFVLRGGRMTVGQQRAYEQGWPQFGLMAEQGMIDPAQVFGRDAPLVLEIGFGMGQSLATMAANEPEKNFIGIEVHPPGVGSLLLQMADAGLSNLRIYQHDAVEVLRDCIAEAALDRLQLYFPDPWHKKKHHKRRIVQPEFVVLIAQKLKPGGEFHMATDWQPYAEHMLEIMQGAAQFENTAASGDYVPRPDTRPLTKFERRGERLGHGVWDLVFRRV